MGKHQAWKKAERRVARAFGVKDRRGPTGRDDSDFEHALISCEVKYRKELPALLVSCLEQARTARSAAGKIPVSIILGRGMRVSDGLLVIRVADFQELFGPIADNRKDWTDPKSTKEAPSSSG